MKSVIQCWKTTAQCYHLRYKQSIPFNLIKMSARKLHFVYYVMAFTTGTGVNNNCVGIHAKFSKFARVRGSKTVILCFGGIINGVIISALKSLQSHR